MLRLFASHQIQNSYRQMWEMKDLIEQILMKYAFLKAADQDKWIPTIEFTIRT